MRNIISAKSDSLILNCLIDSLAHLILSKQIFISMRTPDGIVFGQIKKILKSSINVHQTYQFVKDSGWKTNDRYPWDLTDQSIIKIHLRYSDLRSEIISCEWEFSDKGSNPKYRGCMLGDDFPLNVPIGIHETIY